MFVKRKPHRSISPTILIVTNAAVFIVGFYVSRTVPVICLAQHYPANFSTFIESAKTNSANVSTNMSFYDIGIKYQSDKVTFHRYDMMYEKYLRKYVGTNISILEIGLGCGMTYGPGSSAYLWREYLGPRADIHFIEFDERCGREWYTIHGEKLNVGMHFGSQENVPFLNTISSTNRDYFDVIVDDGGHTMKQQITSLTHLLRKVRPGGLYVIEDLQTSYFGAGDPDIGYLVNSTTIELIKRLVDDVQGDSPQKTTPFAGVFSSFELSSRICFFNKI